MKTKKSVFDFVLFIEKSQCFIFDASYSTETKQYERSLRDKNHEHDNENDHDENHYHHYNHNDDIHHHPYHTLFSLSLLGLA